MSAEEKRAALFSRRESVSFMLEKKKEGEKERNQSPRGGKEGPNCQATKKEIKDAKLGEHILFA